MESPVQSDLGGLQDQDSDTETMDTLDSQVYAGKDQVCQQPRPLSSLQPSDPSTAFYFEKQVQNFP